MATPYKTTDEFLTNSTLTIDQAIAWEQVKALRALVVEAGRLADVYLYVNDPEGDEAEQPQAGRTLPDGFRGMR